MVRGREPTSFLRQKKILTLPLTNYGKIGYTGGEAGREDTAPILTINDTQ